MLIQIWGSCQQKWSFYSTNYETENNKDGGLIQLQRGGLQSAEISVDKKLIYKNLVVEQWQRDFFLYFCFSSTVFFCVCVCAFV